MEKQDLIDLSPVRIFDAATEGGLKAGELGLVTAKKGLGKTSVLVQFAIDSLLNDKHLVHISFDQHSSNVIAWYDSILAEIAKKKHIKISDIAGDIVRERTILNFNQENFTLPKVVATIKALNDGGINVSSIVIDGLDLAKTSKEDLSVMEAFVKDNNMTAWFSYTNEASDIECQLDADKLALFGKVAHLSANGNELFMTVLKPVDAEIRLDSKSTLMTK
ncbi:MAG: hypothetical protein MJ181_05330 [Treponema sp.]|nr:hypothetical protein [Treponema sp.]